jgi:Sulfatase
MIDMHQVVGRANLLWVTLDCLRHDVACRALAEGRTPNLRAALPPGGWEARETPGTFTLAAHQAFFHGFLPTPPGNGPHPRLLALEFEGSLTIAPQTYTFRGADNVIAGLRQLGYRTFCVGGVGFFNLRNPLGRVLPGYFAESVWDPSMGVTARASTAAQVRAALGWLETVRPGERFLLFVNVSATHPPHAHYLEGAAGDSPASQAAALAYVDSQLPPLFAALRGRGACFCLFMADHGEAHGEDGRRGHRLAHPTVTTVPYAHFFL